MGSGFANRVRALGLLVACALVVASCGARWTADQEKALDRRDAGSARSASATTVVESAADGGSTVEGGSVEAPAASGVDPGVAGTGSGEPTASGPLPCAAPSTATGVTDKVLTVGNLATTTGPIPGLGSTAQASAVAYVAYLNSRGGVCGRQVKLLLGDDGNDGSRARQVMADFAPKALGVIALFAPSGGAAADVIKSNNLPVLGAIGDPEIRKLPSVFNTNPPPSATTPAKKFEYLKANGVRTAAVVTLSAAAAVLELDQHQKQMELAGIKIVSRQILPVTTLSFDSVARAVANSKADYLFFLSADSQDASMAQAMRDTGYKLKFEEYLTGYGSNYPKLAGAAAEGTTAWLRAVPIEEAATYPEMAKFLEWMRRAAPDSPTDVFAADGWASSKAFFDGLEALKGPITREALIEQMRTLTTYDAGGLLGRIDLAHGESNGCLIGVRYQSGKWQRMAPASGFLC